jgi:aryl-alcohol dehydrogenase-like predicted oxidoreductase/transcriptional regulator with XRE-family HTH domain
MAQTRSTAERANTLAGADGAGEARTTRLGDYLRSLREGYGYTLRKVEERALTMGEAIDNSQLSRFEKGKAIPSFEKLRALARVFNVPVQNFSDVLDLEEYQHLKPTTADHDALMRAGAEWMARGEHGRAFVTYERALEVSRDCVEPNRAAELGAEARSRMAVALKALGKLYMTERELREILKRRAGLTRATRRRTLLQLSYLHRELGDLYLASVLAKESLELARREGDRLAEAGVLNTLGNIEHDEDRPETAREHYEDALAILGDTGGHGEMGATVLTNLGGCLVTLSRFDEGVGMLREAHTKARSAGYRRVAALSLTRLGEAFKQGVLKRSEVIVTCRVCRHNNADTSADATIKWIEEDLTTLGIDYADGVFVHDPGNIDALLTSGGTLDGLLKLKEQGVIGAIGLGCHPLDYHLAALDTGKVDMLLTFNEYNLLRQEAAAELLVRAAEQDVGVLNGWSIVRGILTGEDVDTAAARGGWSDNADDIERAKRIREWCLARDVNMLALTLQFCLREERIHGNPIALTTIEEIDAALEAVTETLPEDLWQEYENLAI